MLQLYLDKYSDGSLFMVLKSLVYFEDADKDNMPDMLIPVKWKTVKEAVIAVHKEFVRLNS